MENKQISILYVDDEPINLILFEAMFNGHYKVKTIESPLKGLDFLNENIEIDIVFSDMRMPKLNGIEFVKEAIKLVPSATYFVLTGFDITKEIEEALEENIIKEYFQKPFQKQDLINAIKKYVNQK